MATLYDAIPSGVGSIPVNAEAVGGYLNGLYAWSHDNWGRFSGLWVPIWVYIPGVTVNGAADAQEAAQLVLGLGLLPGSTIVLDVEAGDANAALGYAADFCRELVALGWAPAIYTSLSTWALLRAHVSADWWIAHYTNVPHLEAGSSATQYASPGQYDLSLTVPGWPKRPHPVTPANPVVARPTTSEPRGSKMLSTVNVPTDPSGNGWVATGLPWSSFESVSRQGNYPPVDGYSHSWYVGAQDRDGMVLVEVVGATPNSAVNVFVVTADAPVPGPAGPPGPAGSVSWQALKDAVNSLP